VACLLAQVSADEADLEYSPNHRNGNYGGFRHFEAFDFSNRAGGCIDDDQELCNAEDWEAEINDDETRVQYAEAHALLASCPLPECEGQCDLTGECGSARRELFRDSDYCVKIQRLASNCTCLWRHVSNADVNSPQLVADACLDFNDLPPFSWEDSTPSQENTPEDCATHPRPIGCEDETWSGDGETSAGEPDVPPGTNLSGGATSLGDWMDRVSHVNPKNVTQVNLTEIRQGRIRHRPELVASVIDQNSFAAGAAVGACGVLLVGAAMFAAQARRAKQQAYASTRWTAEDSAADEDTEALDTEALVPDANP